MTPDTPTRADSAETPAPTPERRETKTSKAKLASARDWKRRNAERVKALDDARNAERGKDPAYRAEHSAYKSALRKQNADKCRAYDKARYSDKTRAQLLVRNKIYRGLVSRGPCVFCGSVPADAHHEDYSKPREVVWVCRTHHQAIHRGRLHVRPEQITRI